LTRIACAMMLQPRMQSANLRELDRLFRALPGVRTSTLALGAVLAREVDALVDGHRAQLPAMAELLRLHAPWPGDERSAGDEPLFRRALSLDDARATIAGLHRFARWSDVIAASERVVDPRFEAGADAIVGGDARALRELVRQEPSLSRARSPFGHRATLLHHVAANGVEETRQWQSPANAPEIARILLDAGAEPDATCSCYRDDDTPLGLLVTSAHPAAAGVQAELVELLCGAGASVNGLDDDCAPLRAASSFGYTAAVDALVRCGARRDDLVLAAAAGDLAAVCSHFDDAGALKPSGSSGHARIPGQPLQREHALEYALIQAAFHGRTAIVELLLTKHPDLSVREPSWNSTALGAARWAKHHEIVALLEPLAPS
jgi:hypothetical protein